jgi:hypothetical protein
MEIIMNRRIMLTSIALLGLAVATSPERGLAQSDPLTGLWQLNVAKSKYSPGQRAKPSIFKGTDKIAN